MRSARRQKQFVNLPKTRLGQRLKSIGSASALRRVKENERARTLKDPEFLEVVRFESLNPKLNSIPLENLENLLSLPIQGFPQLIFRNPRRYGWR